MAAGGAGACCPRDRLLVAARLAPSVGGRSGVLRLEMYAQSPSTLVPDADNAWREIRCLTSQRRFVSKLGAANREAALRVR
jgi:hypothetical protein